MMILCNFCASSGFIAFMTQQALFGEIRIIKACYCHKHLQSKANESVWMLWINRKTVFARLLVTDDQRCYSYLVLVILRLELLRWSGQPFKLILYKSLYTLYRPYAPIVLEAE